MPVLSRRRTSWPEPRPRALSSSPRCQAVERPCTPAPITTKRALSVFPVTGLVPAWLFPALERAGLIVLADDPRAFDPRPHDGLRKLRVLALQPDAIRVPGDEVLHKHLASDVVFLAL